MQTRLTRDRNSCVEVFCKKSIFKNFCKKAIFKNLAKFIEKEPVPESLFRKVADLQIATILKTGSKTGFFSRTLQNILRTTI